MCFCLYAIKNLRVDIEVSNKHITSKLHLFFSAIKHEESCADDTDKCVSHALCVDDMCLCDASVADASPDGLCSKLFLFYLSFIMFSVISSPRKKGRLICYSTVYNLKFRA